jgi:stage V sporulation protein SpoVS
VLVQAARVAPAVAAQALDLRMAPVHLEIQIDQDVLTEMSMMMTG